MTELGLDAALLDRRNGRWTAREIEQQPEMLRATHRLLAGQTEALRAFVAPFTTDPSARIILTGAGTSSFIGECLAPWLDHRLAARVEAIATTDIVSAPHLYLDRSAPTLLVSFGRSGNSPESAATVDLANEFVPGVRHLVVTCNADGALARGARREDFIIQLPDATHDRGFAMTSSFTSMTYAALAALNGVEAMADRIEPIAHAVEVAVGDSVPLAAALADGGFTRVVYLGSTVFKGLACEAALKLMELTDGGIVATSDTPLGFRHGPKTIVTNRTLVAVLLSNDPLTRRYDLDLLAELQRDGRAGRVIAISAQDMAEPAAMQISGLARADDIDLLFPYIVLPQVFALHASLAAGVTPDNPNAAGVVSRVVQGVAIHSLATA
jgi:tagatose-6-phosphate ketose/aldose isomerase